jgi:hypothetical protein
MKLFLVIFMFLGACNVSATEINFFYLNQKSTIQRPNEIFLRDVMLDGPIFNDIDWDMSLISNNVSDRLIEERKNNLIEKLQKLKIKWISEGRVDLAASIFQLQHDISDLKVAGRIATRLDPDYLFVHSEKNVKLKGMYNIYLAKRDIRLHIIGLVNAPNSIDLKQGFSISDYIKDNTFLDGADINEGYLIEGNGLINRVPIAYWNNHHIEPSPASTLFIGIDQNDLPSGYESINNDIATLIANKIQE